MVANLTIKRNDKEEHLSIDIPTSWPQVTFSQFKELSKGYDIIKALCILTGLDEELIRKAEIHNLSAITACLHFLSKEIEYTLPPSVLGYKIVENLEIESIAQFADLQSILKELKQDDPHHNFSRFPLIVATYAVDPYDFTKAEQLQNEFLKAPCTEVLAVANFTLVKLAALNRGIVKTYHREDTHLSRFRQDLRHWLLSLTSTIHYYLWKRSLPLSERNYLNGL